MSYIFLFDVKYFAQTRMPTSVTRGRKPVVSRHRAYGVRIIRFARAARQREQFETAAPLEAWMCAIIVSVTDSAVRYGPSRAGR
jgi:hypothetical protein